MWKILTLVIDSWNDPKTKTGGLTGKKMLNFNKVRDLFMSEQIHRRELDITPSSSLSEENRGRLISMNSNQGKMKSKIKSKSNTRKSNKDSICCPKI